MKKRVREEMKKAALIALAIGMLGLTPASPAGYFTNGVPPAGGTQYPSTIPLTGNETFPADTNLLNGANPASESISTSQLAGYLAGQPGFSSFRNTIIGGDASTNLFQRGTTGASVTTTIAYGGPDRWFYWSGTGTAMTVSQDQTAADFPSTGYTAAFKMARTSGQTGVIPVCMGQVVESANTVPMQGSSVEVDFHVTAGANFSPTNSILNVYVITGTGTDEGSTKVAFGLNGGGSGSSGWTGQANAVSAAIPVPAFSARYTAVGLIPATANEVALVFCFTPTGTAGTNDYVALTGIQLTRNLALAGFIGQSGLSSSFAASTFERRPQGIETLLQQRYTYSVLEGTITAGSAIGGVGMAPTATTCLVNVPFPVQMRIAPSYTNFLTATTFKLNSAAANAALSTPFSAITGANNTQNGSITFTASGLGATAGFACELVSAAGSGTMRFVAEE